MAFVNERAFTWKKFVHLIKFMVSIVSEHKFLFFVSTIFTILDILFFSSTSYLINKLIKSIVEDEKSNFLFLKNLDRHDYFYLTIGYIAVYAIIDFLSLATLGFMGVQLEVSTRKKCIKRLVENDISFYSNNQLGLLMSRTITDSFNVYNGYYNFMMNVFYVFFGSAIVFATSFVIDVNISFILLGIYFFLVIFTWVIFIYYRRASIVSILERQDGDRVLTDKLLNIRLIKSSGSELEEIEDVNRLSDKFEKLHTKYINWQSILIGIGASLGWIAPLITTWLAILWGNKNGESSIEITTKCITFVSVDYALIKMVTFIPGTIRSVTKTMNAVDRLSLIIDSESIIKYSDDPKTINEIHSIEFKDVNFSYPEMPHQQILNNINLKFIKGKKYAFVGETGSGKSSIARLLLRLYDTTTGDIIINDKYSIRDLDIKNYLSNVGYVEQEPQIIYGDVYDNILYGNFDKTKEEAIAAAKQAELDKFVNSLPQGYNTILGERGFMLSGGQKQRIVIARTILKSPDLLILDEATSALDNIVEKQIQKALDKISEGRTTVSIAHRLSTIKDYDTIFVLAPKKGVVESGSYKELLKIKDGVFKKIHDSGKL